MLASRIARLAGAFGLASLSLVACSAGNNAPQRPGGGGDVGIDNMGGASNGTGGTGTGRGGAGGTGAAGTVISTNGGGQPRDGATGCQNLQVVFEPKIPTVAVLVDRSGSMFDSMVWEPLRTSVLQIIQATQADVRYGFAAFTGEAGGACPAFDSVPIAQNNYTAIATLYNRLNKPIFKAETPTTLALRQVEDGLMADPGTGLKYILFVTDGEPDFCDDSNHICAVDSVVHQLQAVSAAGIQTFVFGLKSSASDISVASLQAFANAGAGQPVLAPIAQMPAPLNIFYQCSGVPGWTADLATAGKTGMTSIGTYSPTNGTAILFNPDLTNPTTGQATLLTQLTGVIAGVKSCLFDLSGKIEVDVNQLDQASVVVEGAMVPLDSTNGWRMNTSSQLELVGSACDTWRKPENTHIDFNFPCGIIIIR